MKRALTLFKKLAVATVFAGSLTLAACGQGQQTKEDGGAPAAVQNPYTWNAVAPTVVSDPGPPARIQLSGGYAAAVFASTAVNPGDAVTARFTIQGTTGRYVRVILQRHCNPDAGDDMIARDILLDGQPQQEEIALTFGQHYDCIRFSLVSNGGQNTEVTVHDLSITKTP